MFVHDQLNGLRMSRNKYVDLRESRWSQTSKSYPSLSSLLLEGKSRTGAGGAGLGVSVCLQSAASMHLASLLPAFLSLSLSPNISFTPRLKSRRLEGIWSLPRADWRHSQSEQSNDLQTWRLNSRRNCWQSYFWYVNLEVYCVQSKVLQHLTINWQRGPNRVSFGFSSHASNTWIAILSILSIRRVSRHNKFIMPLFRMLPKCASQNRQRLRHIHERRTSSEWEHALSLKRYIHDDRLLWGKRPLGDQEKVIHFTKRKNLFF